MNFGKIIPIRKSLHPIGISFKISKTAALFMKTLSFLINMIESITFVSILYFSQSSLPISDCREANLNLPTLSLLRIKLTEPVQRLHRSSKKMMFR